MYQYQQFQNAPTGQYGAVPPSGYPQPGGPPPAGAYPGGPPPAGAYAGGPPPAGAYAGGPPPAGAYPGGAPPAGQYQGGPPPQGPPAGGAPLANQYKGEVPSEDVHDDPNAKPPEASAPSVDKMDTVSGYNNVGFSAAMLPPPSYDDATRGPPPERREISNVPTITEQDAREALMQHVAEHCCYGKGAAQEMQFVDLKSTSAFHYTLETYGEARTTCWAYEPFRGQVIDGPHNGPAPGPWDISATPATLFKNSKMDVEVPHTASVKPCHNCYATGRIRCWRCHGRGRIRCGSCSGSGWQTRWENGEEYRDRCTWCHGDGRRHCYTCHGCGMVDCEICQAACQLKCFIKLTIIWTNHMNDHIVERTALPDELIRGVSGQVAFEESVPRVWPINHFPDAEINSASQRLVAQHASAFPTERYLMQRHQVRIIPVTQAMYKWKDNTNDFFVYGFENKVHAPTYPQQCCCGCTIL